MQEASSSMAKDYAQRLPPPIGYVKCNVDASRFEHASVVGFTPLSEIAMVVW